MFDFLSVLFTALATFGIATLISQYDGVADVFLRLRSIEPLHNFLSCTVCLSLWISIPFSVANGIGVIGYFATVGIVILLERLV